MLSKLNEQVWLGIVWLAGSSFFLYKAFNYPYFAVDKPGAGFFPIWICGIMVVFSILQIVTTLKDAPGKTAILPVGKNLKNILVVFSGMILFILLAPFTGFTIACSLFMSGLFYYNGYKWQHSLIWGLASAIFLFLLFHTLLGVAFPVNDLGW